MNRNHIMILQIRTQTLNKYLSRFCHFDEERCMYSSDSECQNDLYLDSFHIFNFSVPVYILGFFYILPLVEFSCTH